MPQTRHYFQAGGTTFPRAVVTTPLCCPSRASILTGRYAHNHRVVNNEARLVRQLDQKRTIEYRLRRVGYRTAIVGKYLNKWPGSRRPPYFDEWTISLGGAPYYAGRWNDNGEIRSPNVYSTTFIAKRAQDFLTAAESADDQPWFLVVATSAPHGPARAEPKYEYADVRPWRKNPAIDETDMSDKPEYVQESNVGPAVGQNMSRRQLRTLISVDDAVGAIRSTLASLGEDRNTLAFFLSDNGVMWGEHNLRSKAVPYTPSVSVPLMMRWPERVPAGVQDGRLAANIDLAPTIFDAVGLPLLSWLDGRSLLSEAAGFRKRVLIEFVEGGHYPAPTWASTLTKRSQYVEYYAGDEKTVTFREYYDLRADPWQLYNLLGGSNPGNDPDVRALSKRLKRDRKCVGDSCP